MSNAKNTSASASGHESAPEPRTPRGSGAEKPHKSHKPQQSQKPEQIQQSQKSQQSQKPEQSEQSHERQESRSSPEPRRPKPMEVLREARAQFAELTGTAAEAVSSFERTEEGWSLEIEVLELERVPDTMSLLATYQVTLDAEGMLTGYRRVRRYERGRSDRGPGGR